MKYIDSEKLIAEIKRYKNKADERLKIKGRSYAEEEKDSALQNLCGNLLHFISSLQQRPETPSGEEVMTMCNQILLDWVKEGKTPEEREQREQAHIRFFELYDKYMQEQPEVDLEKEIESYYCDNFAFISSVHIPTLDILTDIAKHFYELGRARKEE